MNRKKIVFVALLLLLPTIMFLVNQRYGATPHQQLGNQCISQPHAIIGGEIKKLPLDRNRPEPMVQLELKPFASNDFVVTIVVPESKVGGATFQKGQDKYVFIHFDPSWLYSRTLETVSIDNPASFSHRIVRLHIEQDLL